MSVVEDVPPPAVQTPPEPAPDAPIVSAQSVSDDDTLMTIQSQPQGEPSGADTSRVSSSRSIAGNTRVPSFQDRLQTVPVAYETPNSVSYGRSFQVTFAVDGTGDLSATDALTGNGTEVVEGQAQVSDRIRALLIGPAFEIEIATPEIQRLSAKTENVWRWDVTPTEEGEHALFVELYALDGEEALPVRTFRDEIIVTVTDFQRMLNIANTLNPLAIVISGIGTVVGGLIGLFRFYRRRRMRT